MPDQLDIAIVGGGIAGLYCALELTNRHHNVTLYETLDHLGGRIETVDLDGFKAECGPMRFEIDIEPRFRDLVQNKPSDGGLGMRFAPFTPPASGQSEHPKFELEPREMSRRQVQAIADTEALGLGGKALASMFSHHTTTLDLLRYGIFRVFHPKPEDRALSLPEVVDERGEKPSRIAEFALEMEKRFDEIRTIRRLTNPATGLNLLLRQYGFWNALEYVLSPGAVAKIRDTGTFYHLLPENPSASEWSIFWLRLFRDDLKLFTIKDGVYSVVQALEGLLRAKSNFNPPQLRAKVKAIQALGDHHLALTVEREGKLTIEPSAGFDHVILALPAIPLKNFTGLPLRIQNYATGVIPFTLTKVFAVIDHPWWPKLPEVQAGAHRVPTREIHYTPAPDGSDRAMVMFYTDRPATAYWHPHIMEPHLKPQRDTPAELRADIVRQLAQLLPSDNLNEIAHFRRVDHSLRSFLIREWAHSPFGAASHAWRPGIDVVEALSELKAFDLTGSPNAPKNVHICGEAYSNYQGFIEGALESATMVVAEIV